MQEWPTRSRQPDTLDLVHAPASQALMHRIVLAVDGKQRFALLTRLSRDEFSCGNKTLLISQPQNLSRAHRLVGRLQPRNPHDRANHEINFRMRRDPNSSATAVHNLDLAQPFLLESGP